MNRNELRRNSTMPLPDPGEKNMQRVILMLNAAVLDLQNTNMSEDTGISGNQKPTMASRLNYIIL